MALPFLGAGAGRPTRYMGFASHLISLWIRFDRVVSVWKISAFISRNPDIICQNSLGVQPMLRCDFSSPMHLWAAAGEIPPPKSEMARAGTRLGKGLRAKFGCGHPVWVIKEMNNAVTSQAQAGWPHFQRTGLDTFNLEIKFNR